MEFQLGKNIIKFEASSRTLQKWHFIVITFFSQHYKQTLRRPQAKKTHSWGTGNSSIAGLEQTNDLGDVEAVLTSYISAKTILLIL